jgi:hypothetical protein
MSPKETEMMGFKSSSEPVFKTQLPISLLCGSGMLRILSGPGVVLLSSEDGGWGDGKGEEEGEGRRGGHWLGKPSSSLSS